MRDLQQNDVIGRRITDFIVSVPDKPVTASTMPHSPSYLRLDTGLLFRLGQPDNSALSASDESVLSGLKRDAVLEQEFRPLLGQQITDVAGLSGTETMKSVIRLPMTSFCCKSRMVQWLNVDNSRDGCIIPKVQMSDNGASAVVEGGGIIAVVCTGVLGFIFIRFYQWAYRSEIRPQH
jgi:hypothetical protein